MGKMLVVTDAAAKVSALQGQLGGEAEVFVLAGLPVKVSLKPSSGPQGSRGAFAFSFAPLPAGEPLLAKLREYSGSDIYIACEVDRRGEFLSWLVTKAMDFVDPGATSALKRLHLLALHDEELRESFRRVEPIREEWAVGYHDRSAFDLALGKHLERLLGTRRGPAGIPLSTPCLAMIFLLAERETEIRTYASRPKQHLNVKLRGTGGVFPARLAFAYGVTDDGDLSGVNDVGEVMRLLEGANYVVHKVERTPLTVAPPTPYRLVELLEDAYVLHGISVAQVLATAQQLFSGVTVDGRSLGLITTYAAVDTSPAVTVDKIRRQVERVAGAEAVRAEDTLATGEGFLLPTCFEIEGSALAQELGDEGVLVYELIRSRALASQMRPALGETVAVEIKAGEHCYFHAASSTVADLGFLAVFQGRKERELARPCPLAPLAEGEVLTVEQVAPEQTGDGLAQHYTIETLFADLADFAMEPVPADLDLLHQLMTGKYVDLLPSGELRCRENAGKIVATFKRLFPTMPGINLSAYLEQTVAEVLTGRKALDVALRQFDQTMIMKGNVLRKVAVPVTLKPRLRPRKSRSVIKADAPSPPPVSPPAAPPAVPSSAPEPPQAVETVEAEAVEVPMPPAAAEAAGGEGQSVVEPAVEAEAEAEAVPADEVTAEEMVATAEGDGVEATAEAEVQTETQAESFEVEAAEVEAEVPEVSSVELALEGVEELPGEEPAAVSVEAVQEAEEIFAAEAAAAEAEPQTSEPDVAVQAELPEPDVSPEGEGLMCPVCGKSRILSKRTPTGKSFFVCPQEACEFMAWAPPHPLPCQVCGSPFLVEKKERGGLVFLRCPRAGCNYRQPLPGEDGAALLAAEQAHRKKKVLVRRVAGKKRASGGKTRKVLVRRRK